MPSREKALRVKELVESAVIEIEARAADAVGESQFRRDRNRSVNLQPIGPVTVEVGDNGGSGGARWSAKLLVNDPARGSEWIALCRRSNLDADRIDQQVLKTRSLVEIKA